MLARVVHCTHSRNKRKKERKKEGADVARRKSNNDSSDEAGKTRNDVGCRRKVHVESFDVSVQQKKNTQFVASLESRNRWNSWSRIKEDNFSEGSGVCWHCYQRIDQWAKRQRRLGGKQAKVRTECTIVIKNMQITSTFHAGLVSAHSLKGSSRPSSTRNCFPVSETISFAEEPPCAPWACRSATATLILTTPPYTVYHAAAT